MSLSVVLDNVRAMDHFIPLGLMGVRVVRCPQLGRESVYFHRFDLLVIDADLTPDQSERVACEALGLAVARMTAA